MLNRSRSRQRGMTLVELMVGVAVGMFVVAAAAMLTSNQLSSNRRLLLETQVQQDMRAALDIITRDLRRAGYSLLAENLVWPYATSGPNAKQAIALPNSSEIRYEYDRASGESGPYGYRYNAGSKTVQTLLATSGWQDLTDSRTVKVTTFTITDVSPPAVKLPCARMCTDGTDACWPSLTVRDYRVDITAEAVTDSTVQRSLSTNVRVRTDAVNFNDATSPNALCPK